MAQANFRTFYYHKIGFDEHNSARTTFAELLKEPHADTALLRRACLRLGIPLEMRLLVYRVFLGETDRQAEFDDLLACVNLRDTAVLALHRDALMAASAASAAASNVSPDGASTASLNASTSTSTTLPEGSQAAASLPEADPVHACLAGLRPYVSELFPDMYAVWAGEMLVPVGTTPSAHYVATHAARAAIARIMAQVTDSDTTSFWLTAAFCAHHHRHVVEAERAGMEALENRIMQAVELDSEVVVGHLASVGVRANHPIFARWMAGCMAETLDDELVIALWDIYLAADTLSVFALAGAAVLITVRRALFACRSATDVERVLAPANLQALDPSARTALLEHVTSRLPRMQNV